MGTAVTPEELKDRVWQLCHTLLNGDVEVAEELAEQLMEDLEP